MTIFLQIRQHLRLFSMTFPSNHKMLVGARLQPVAVVSLFSNRVTPEKPYLSVNSESLFFIVDPTRDMLFKSDFRVGSHTIKSSYTRQAYYRDREMQIRFIPKLSARYFNLSFTSKMSVKLAAQVFSNHCAAAFQQLPAFQQWPAEAMHVARFIERINRLFGSLNIPHKLEKSACAFAMCARSVNKKVLEAGIAVFENIKVLGCARQPKTVLFASVPSAKL